MFTSLDKALVAGIMAVIFVINNLFHLNIGISEQTLNAIVGALTPVLVYYMPNREK